MAIYLSSILNIQNLKDYKLHLACWNGKKQPLDVFVRSREKWKEWNSSRRNKDDFSRKYIFSLIDFYHNNGIWLFGGVYEVKKRERNGYEVELMDDYKDFIGRLKIGFKRPNGWRGRAFKLEKSFHLYTVSEILQEPYSGEMFCGFENINHDFNRLATIFENNRPDWKAALESIKGVYLIVDKNNGKKYVGSAYGENGIWSRWASYCTGSKDFGHKGRFIYGDFSPR